METSVYWDTSGKAPVKTKTTKAARQDEKVTKALIFFKNKYKNGMTVDDFHYEFFCAFSLKYVSVAVLTMIFHMLGYRKKCRESFDNLVRLIGDKSGIRRSCDTLIGKGKLEDNGTAKGVWGKQIRLHKLVK